MLSAIPRTMWIRAWLRSHREAVVNTAFVLIPLAVALLYWPMRQVLVIEEERTVVHVSNVSVVIILLVGYVSWGIGKLIDKRFLKGRSWLLRQAVWLGLTLVIFIYLDLVGGLDFRW